MEKARGRLLALSIAWGLAFVLAYAGAAPLGLFSIVLLPGFPAGLVFLLPLRHLSDETLTIIVIFLWAFYVWISGAIVVAKKEKHVAVLAGVLGLLLFLNVAGCRMVAHGLSRVGH